MKNISIAFLAIISITFFSCDKEDSEVKIETNYTKTLSNLGNNVIIQTYFDLKTKSSILETVTNTFVSNPNATNLLSLKNAWLAVRQPWEQAEGFGFGPVDKEGIDPSVDSWPLNLTDLDAILTGTNVINTAFVATQEGNLKGFHTAEYLIWGINGNKLSTDFTSRELNYLKATSANLAIDTNKLYNLWIPSGQDFVDNFINAGNSTSTYTSQKVALKDLIDAIIGITDELANNKIDGPFAANDATLMESRFSDNSSIDFINNISSVKNIYFGTYYTNGNSFGLYKVINSKDPATDYRVKTQINEAIVAIQAIPASFKQAIVSNRDVVANAQTKLRALQETLETKVSPIIEGL